MSGRKTSKNVSSDKIGGTISRPILFGVFGFAFWLLFFILTDIYFSGSSGFGSSEITSLGIFRSRFSRADFSSYTFEAGLGMSIPRLLLSGYGGVLSLPFSLLPVSIHPQAMAFLNAIRLGLSGAVFFYMLSSFSPKRSSRSSSVLSFLYTAALLGLCYLLRFPVSDAFFLFPGVLLRLFRDTGKEKKTIALSDVFLLCLLFLSSATWDLLLFPVLLLTLLLRKKKTEALSGVLSFGLCAFILLPQFLQMPCAIKGEPSASFLRKIGNDTDKYHTDVTYTTEATKVLLNQKHSVLVISAQNKDEELPSGSSPAGSTEDPSGSETIFDYLNDWFYSLWPSLPAIPFQNTYSEGPVYSDTRNVSFTVTTMFSDPLFCAVKLPSLHHPVDLYVNDRLVSTISNSNEKVLVNLGTYNVGQNLTVRLHSSHPEDLKNASSEFGYMNSINWNRFTENATFGISDMEENADGITADALVAFDSTLLTNIPYEKGWSLYVNGEKHPVLAYRDAWVSSDISSGHYTIHLHYTAPGTAWGGWISCVSFFLLAVFCFHSGRATKDHSSSSSEDPEITSSSGASSRNL
ncbi:MAG: YfhO family protein [Clostridiales bacterium]|nr:YfhO family protein [Clostridiales bacterium]